MKKCVKCGTKYDDSEVICPKCNMYLITDVLSDLSEESFNKKGFAGNKSFFADTNSNFEKAASSRRRNPIHPVDENVTEDDSASFFTGAESTFSGTDTAPSGSDSSRRRRNRVHPVEEASNSEPVKRTSSSSFQPSEESDDYEEESVQPVYRRRIRRRRFRQIMRRLLSWLRILVPVLMIVIAASLIIRNWVTVKEFLEACLVGGIIGSVLLTFLSIRFGTHFNAEITITGAISGAIIGCIIRYNLLGSAADLSALLDALMPCIICCVGLYIIVRGTFNRR